MNRERVRANPSRSKRQTRGNTKRIMGRRAQDVFLLLSACLLLADAYPSGAPSGTCTGMTPNHGANSQPLGSGNGGYTVSFASSYTGWKPDGVSEYRSKSTKVIRLRDSLGGGNPLRSQLQQHMDSTSTCTTFLDFGQLFEDPFKGFFVPSPALNFDLLAL